MEGVVLAARGEDNLPGDKLLNVFFRSPGPLVNAREGGRYASVTVFGHFSQTARHAAL
jgi:hypothetical protein